MKHCNVCDYYVPIDARTHGCVCYASEGLEMEIVEGNHADVCSFYTGDEDDEPEEEEYTECDRNCAWCTEVCISRGDEWEWKLANTL